MDSEEIKKKNQNSKAIYTFFNALVGLFFFSFSFFFFTAIGIEAVLGIALFFVILLLAKFHEKYRLYGTYKKFVRVLQVASVLLFGVMVFVPTTFFAYKDFKPMYSIQRFVFFKGNYSGADERFFPKKLPKECREYYFITQGSTLAQNYHPSAYLIFHTDSETLSEYENYFESLENAERKVTHMPDKEDYYDDLWIKCPKELPQHVFQRLQPEHIHDFKNAVIYIVHAYYGKGCMLDYDSGLAVFWY